MRNFPSDPITVVQAAAILGVHPNTITRKIGRGELSGVQLHAGIRAPYVVSRAEVEALAKNAA
jgi:excisionase family DNA binding protein